MKAIHYWHGCSTLLIAVAIALPTIAQVVPNGSVGTTVSAVGSQYTINNGTQVGGNLFHSFSQFSIPTGGAARFNNALTVQTIFARVTGGSVSNIDGLIQANGTASLFLLNPAGILFGSNASLNLGGSFVATTANSVIFADGVKFNATETTTPALLTMSVPIGLQFGKNAGDITVRGSGHRLGSGNFIPLDRSQNPNGLEVGAGKTLALIGGAVSFSGGIASIPGGGHLEIGSVSEGQVRLNPTEQGWVGDYSAVQQFNNIHLAQQSLLDASGSNGSIQIQGQNIGLTEGSVAVIQNSGAQPSGGIAVHATGLLNLTGNTPDGGAGSLIRIDNLGMGETGNLTIAAAQLAIQNGGGINASTFTQAPGSNITVNVAGSIAIAGFTPANPGIQSQLTTVTYSTANAGNLTVSMGNLRLVNGASFGSQSIGSGQSGTLQVNAADFIEIAGQNPITLTPSSLNSAVLGSGNANNMFINTSRLVIRDGGVLGTGTLAVGSAGSVTINASKSVDIQGRGAGSILSSRIISSAEIIDPATQAAFGLPAIPSGDAGAITINTPSLRITNGASVSVKNDGPGRAGDIQINANSIFLGDQGTITASTASGNGGNIRLDLKSLLLMRHGSFLSAMALGAADGGNITINAPIVAGFENSDIIANAVKGRGGNIQITTQGIFGLKYRPQLTPENDITASSEFGVNGTIDITTPGIDPNAGLVALPVNLVDTSQQIATGCAGTQGSSFMATGRGGVPQNPTQQVRDDRTWNDLRDLSAYRQPGMTVAQTPAPPPLLLQATTWQRHADNTVELMTDPSAAALPTVATCSGVTATP